MIIGIKTYNRPDYLKRSMESLKKSNLPENTIIIIKDDCSTDKKTIDIINNVKFLNKIQKIVIKNSSHEGVDKNSRTLFKYCFKKTESNYIIVLNDDIIYNANWYYKMMDAKESIKNEKIGMLTCFNTKAHRGKKYNNIVNINSSVGGMCLIIHRNIALSKEVQKEGTGWDHNAVRLCKTIEYKMFSTIQSYVEHIGLKGQHKRSDNHPLGVVNFAIDFVK